MEEIPPAIYGRVSSERQEHEQTINSQLEELRLAVRESVSDQLIEITDEGYSRDDLARPGLDRLRDLVQSGEVKQVYVLSPDRLASGVKLMVLYDEFSEAGARITFLKGDVENTPEGRLMLHMQGAWGDYEKAKIAERTRRGKLHWARQGYLPVRIKPFGYNYVRRSDDRRATLDVDAEQATVVASIFRWFTQDGMTLRGIAARLEREGVLTPGNGRHWYASVVRKILSNSAYRGERPRNASRAETAARRAPGSARSLIGSRYRFSDWYRMVPGRERRPGYARTGSSQSAMQSITTYFAGYCSVRRARTAWSARPEESAGRTDATTLTGWSARTTVPASRSMPTA